MSPVDCGHARRLSGDDTGVDNRAITLIESLRGIPSSVPLGFKSKPKKVLSYAESTAVNSYEPGLGVRISQGAHQWKKYEFHRKVG